MSVCQTCGSQGYTNLLIYCEACKLVAVHRYCVDGPLNIDDDEVCWSCEECVPRIGQPVVAFRKSKRICSILDREALRRKARRNWKSHPSVSKIKDSNCVGKTANKDSKVASDLDEKKIGIAKGKQGNSKEIGTVAKEGEKVLNCDDGARKTSLQPIVVLGLKSVDLDENKNGNAKRKQVKFKENGTVAKKGGSQPPLQIQPENKVLNSDDGAGEESLQPFLVLGLISEDLINSNVKGEDLQTNLEKKLISEDSNNSNVKGEDLQTNLENKLISEDSNNSNVKGEDPQTNLEKTSGPGLSNELDHSLQNTSKADETNNGDSVSEKWHENEQSSDFHSSLVEERQEIGRSEAAKWPDAEEELVIDNIEETNVVSASHLMVNKPSGFRVYDIQTPRKKRRLVIAMEYSDSDEEPDDVKDEHPQIAPNQQEGFLNASSSEPPANKGDYEFAYKSFMKSDDCFPTQPLLMRSDNHKLIKTSIDFDNNVIPRLSPVMLDHYVPAQPIINAVWRGQCSIRNYAHPQSFGLEAHLSNKAHPKVHGAASLLPNLLHFEIVRKHDAWPMKFNESPPTSDAIGLYFFPVEERDEKWYMHLLDEMIDCDLMLKCQINSLELLVFCSQELPREERRFQCKLYLWGVFMRKQETSLTSEPVDIQTSDTMYHRRDSAVPGTSRSSASPSSVHNCPVTNSSNSHLHQKSGKRVELKPSLFLKHRRPAYKKQGYDSQPEMSGVDRHDHKTSRNSYKPREHRYGNKDVKYPYHERGSNWHRGQGEIRQGKSTNKWKEAPSRHSSHYSRRPYRSPTRYS